MDMKIHEEIIFNTTPKRVYELLLNSEEFSKMTGGAPTEIQAEDGGSFSCFGGMIHGRNIELTPSERIVQAWRAGNWDPGVYSIVTFTLKPQGDQTLLIFDHIGFPEGQADHLKAGWQENYWSNIEKYLQSK